MTKQRIEHTVTEDQQKRASQALDRYSAWINNELLDHRSYQDKHILPTLIYPTTSGKPRILGPSERGPVPRGVFYLLYPTLLGLSEAVLPVGEVKVWSSFTETYEWLPISISMLTPRGSDGLLCALLKRLELAGIIRPVECGWRDSSCWTLLGGAELARRRMVICGRSRLPRRW